MAVWLLSDKIQLKHRKIPKISRGAYFSKALFEGLTFGGAYVRREICVSKPIGLALFLEGNLPFFFVLFCIWGQFFQVQAPRGDIYLEGRFSGGVFCVTSLGGIYLEGLIHWHGGAYCQNFKVYKRYIHVTYNYVSRSSQALSIDPKRHELTNKWVC